MTLEAYFPEQRHLLPITTIRRARMLPNAAGGAVEVTRNQRVSLLDTVARGEALAPFTLVDVARALGLKPDDARLETMIQVGDGSEVSAGDLLAEGRGRKVPSPVAGRVAVVWRGQVVLQELVPTIDLPAGVNGTVVDVRPGRGAVVEGYGGVLQGVWGNGRRGVGSLRMEPRDGIESLVAESAFESDLRGSLVVCRRPLAALTLEAAADQGISGLIAPSLPPKVRAAALAAPLAVMVVEGFGSARMGTSANQFLETNEGRQASLDAATPAPLESRVPELIVSVPFDPNDRPGAPNLNVALYSGLTVRVIRAEGNSSIGTITNLPKMPIIMENGIRVSCAVVTLVTGEQITAPVVNLEVIGA